tara:strand:+ start:1028 stop:2254 length:1227 start_codon:yes stop_codon:yes gene_type:complete
LKLELRFLTYLYTLLFLTASSTPLLSSINFKDIKLASEIGTDYLDKVPENDYLIGPGDVLKVLISRDYPEIGATINMVDGEGTINLPKINRVYVKGLTISELNNLLNDAYKKFVKYPDVEIEIQGYRSIRVLIEGEVQNPGLQTLEGSLLVGNKNFPITQFEENTTIRNYFPTPAAGAFKDNIPNKRYDPFKNKQSNASASGVFYFPTIFDVIREAGGITEYADLSEVQIIRKNSLSKGGGQITTSLNFESVLAGDPTFNIRLYDADIIKIKKASKANNYQLRKAVLSNLNPKYINVFVTGRVNSPGEITVSKASVLSDAIEIAGGAKIIRGPVKFLRFMNDGSLDSRKFKYKKNRRRGSHKNPYLKEGDLIVVDESFLSSSNQVFTEFASPFIGIVSTYGLLRAIND